MKLQLFCIQAKIILSIVYKSLKRQNYKEFCEYESVNIGRI